MAPPLGTFGNQPHGTRQTYGTFGAAIAATHYSDAANQYSERAGSLNGITDSKQLFASIWFDVENPISGGGSLFPIYYMQFNTGSLEIDLYDFNGKIKCNASDLAAPLGTVFDGFTTASAIVNGWNNLMWSFDALAGTRYMYLNDVDVTGAPTLNNAPMRWTQGTPAQKIAGISTTFGASSGYRGCVCETIFNTSVLDLSVVANRRTIITAAGKPVDPGNNAVGKASLLYIPDGKETNLGTGGNLTAFNSPTACGTTP